MSNQHLRAEYADDGIYLTITKDVRGKDGLLEPKGVDEMFIPGDLVNDAIRLLIGHRFCGLNYDGQGQLYIDDVKIVDIPVKAREPVNGQ